jgi:hypothetical protein
MQRYRPTPVGVLLCTANRLDHPGLPRNNHNARNTGNPLNSRSSALAEVYTACSESVVNALALGWAVAAVTNRENEQKENTEGHIDGRRM